MEGVTKKSNIEVVAVKRDVREQFEEEVKELEVESIKL